MRDIAVTVVVFCTLPFILRRPWIGMLVWTWLGFMNPHRLAWGFSTTMPFAYIVALTTMVAMVFSKEEKKLPWTREVIVMICFVGWMSITTIFAFYSQLALAEWLKVIKIFVMVFVGLILINTKERLNWLVLVMALSIGFYGVKGGLFTVLHGGSYRVQGPPGSFIGGNNELGLAMAMTIPLLYYCIRQARNRWLSRGLVVTMGLTVLAAIGTQSRGALVGLLAMGVMFWLKARQKLAICLFAVASVGLVVAVMPQQWYDRMTTIEQYNLDKSVLGRFNAWTTAVNVAKARVFGGGFEMFRAPTFAAYAPDPNMVHDAHSIYFEVLGEHGFVGLALFLTLAAFTWFSASRLKRAARRHPETSWLGDLASMVQVSMVAYGSSGAFLGMAYFDYYYNLVLIIVVGTNILARHRASSADIDATRPGWPATASRQEPVHGSSVARLAASGWIREEHLE